MSEHAQHANISREARRCGCSAFRKAWAMYHREYRARRQARTGEVVLHGRFVRPA